MDRNDTAKKSLFATLKTGLKKNSYMASDYFSHLVFYRF